MCCRHCNLVGQHVGVKRRANVQPSRSLCEKHTTIRPPSRYGTSMSGEFVVSSRLRCRGVVVSSIVSFHVAWRIFQLRANLQVYLDCGAQLVQGFSLPHPGPSEHPARVPATYNAYTHAHSCSSPRWYSYFRVIKEVAHASRRTSPTKGSSDGCSSCAQRGQRSNEAPPQFSTKTTTRRNNNKH